MRKRYCERAGRCYVVDKKELQKHQMMFGLVRGKSYCSLFLLVSSVISAESAPMCTLMTRRGGELAGRSGLPVCNGGMSIWIALVFTELAAELLAVAGASVEANCCGCGSGAADFRDLVWLVWWNNVGVGVVGFLPDASALAAGSIDTDLIVTGVWPDEASSSLCVWCTVALVPPLAAPFDTIK